MPKAVNARFLVENSRSRNGIPGGVGGNFFKQEGRHYDFDIPLGKNSGKFSKVKFCDDQSLARRLLILLLKFRI